MPVDAVAGCRTIVNAMVTDVNTEIAAKESGGTAISPARFTAAVNYYPEYTLAQLGDVRVDLRFVETKFEAESRAGIFVTHDVELTVQKAVRYNETATINLLLDLSARLGKFYAENCEPCGANATNHSSMVTALGANYPLECVSSVLIPYDPNRLHDFGHFWAMLAMSWRECVSS